VFLLKEIKALVEKVVKLAKAYKRPIASPNEAREILGMEAFQ
jgi:uncharacterized protein (DUF849 family)